MKFIKENNTLFIIIICLLSASYRLIHRFTPASVIACVVGAHVLLAAYKLCDYGVMKWIDTVLSVNSIIIRRYLVASIIGSHFLMLAEYILWFLDNNSWTMYAAIIGGSILVYILFISSVYMIIAGENEPIVQNSIKARWNYIICMFIHLWFILTIIIVATLPFHSFNGITYYGPVNNWNFMRNIGNAAYFAIVTISTVGFGDITPRNWIAKLSVIIIVLSGLVFLSVFVNVFLGNPNGKTK